MKQAVTNDQTAFLFAAMSQRTWLLWTGYLFVCLLPVVFGGFLVKDLFALIVNDQTLSHIPFVPLVNAGFLFAERERVFAGERRGSMLGTALAAVGAAEIALARVNPWHGDGYQQTSLFILGLVTIWIGAFGVFFGRDAMRAASFPLFFLSYAVPIPRAWLLEFVALLQSGSANAVDVMFHLIHMPAVRQGFEFALPGVTIRVAEECSGIRSTLALMMTGVLAGRFWLRSPWRTALLTLATVPISIAKNALRIAVLSWLAVYVDPRYLTGPIHHQYGGMIFFSAGLVLMGIALVALRRLRFERPWNAPPSALH
jgi:exosortase